MVRTKHIALLALFLLPWLSGCAQDSEAWMGPVMIGGGVPAAGGTPASLTTYDSANQDDVLQMGRPGVFEYLEQSFIAAGSGTATVTSVRIYAEEVGTAADVSVVFQLYTDSTGPDTQVTDASCSLNARTAFGTMAWVECTFSSAPTITLGTTYWLVVSGATYTDASNTCRWGLDSSSPSYASGSGQYCVGGPNTSCTSWHDFCFDIWGY